MSTLFEENETNVRSARKVHFGEAAEKATERPSHLAKSFSAALSSANPVPPKHSTPTKVINESRTGRAEPTNSRKQSEADKLLHENERLKRELSAKKSHISKVEGFISNSSQGKKNLNTLQELTEQKKALLVRVRELESKLRERTTQLGEKSEEARVLQQALNLQNILTVEDGMDREKLKEILLENARLKEYNQKHIEKLHAQSRDFETLVRERDSLFACVEELKFIRDANLKELDQQERRVQDLTKELERLKQKLSTSERERIQLGEHIDVLNLRLRGHSAQETGSLRERSEINTARIEVGKKEIELNSVKKELEKEILRSKMIKESTAQDEEKIAELISINELLHGEMLKLKALAESVQEENQFFKSRNVDILREKDDLQSQIGGSPRSRDRGVDPFEVRNLREALNEAKTKISSLMMRDSQLRDDGREKERQIENLIASRKLMESNLSTQLQTLRAKVDQYENRLYMRERETKVLSEENKHLRDVLRQGERRRIERGED